MKNSFGSRFQQALRLRGLKQTDISSRTGIALNQADFREDLKGAGVSPPLVYFV